MCYPLAPIERLEISALPKYDLPMEEEVQMANYFPEYEAMCHSLCIDINNQPKDNRIAVTSGFLIALMKVALESSPFRESDYLKFNPDIAEAQRRGDIGDLHRHFIDHGYFEGRRAYAFKVDEDWYLKVNLDVALAVRERDIESAVEHYHLSGEHEWRAPNEACAEEVNRWRDVLLGMQRLVPA
jgi:hypothetical protein